MRSVTDMVRALRTAACGLLLLTLAACVTAPPPDMASTTPDRSVIISVMFDFDSHRIRPEYYPALDTVADALASPQLAGLRYDVNGHTDRAGRFAYNVALSMLRARAVVAYLAARGVPRERMRAQGFGYLMPLDPYNPYDASNRRVEVTSIR